MKGITSRLFPKGTVLIQVAIGLLIIATGLFGFSQNLPIERFFRDPTTVGNVPFHAGVLSQIGLFLWCAAAAACLLAATVLTRTPHRSAQRQFLLWAGLLTTVLLFDDAFLFHEVVASHHMGIPAELVVGSYGAFVALLFWRSRQVVAESPYGLLLVAMGGFGFSVGIDVLKDQQLVAFFETPESTSIRSLLEDGSKLFGIANWCGYLMWMSYEALVHNRPERILGPEGSEEFRGTPRPRRDRNARREVIFAGGSSQ